MNKVRIRYIWLIIGISFWAGMGFMSIVNIIKTALNQHPISYDWIMFAVSITLIVICAILLKKRKWTSYINCSSQGTA